MVFSYVNPVPDQNNMNKYAKPGIILSDSVFIYLFITFDIKFNIFVYI